MPSGGYEPRNAWTECPLYFVHESDFWAPEQRYHMWPKDGFDFAIIIAIKLNQAEKLL